MKPRNIQRLFERLLTANPAPRTELAFESPFELLVAVVLSAQATDKSVNLATPGLFTAANTPAEMIKLGRKGIERHIRHIGLYRTKAKNLAAACKRLVEQHGSEVPRTREALEGLPGVGRKTANVILNTAFGEPTIAVDTHIFRVANRTGLAPGKDVLAVERKLLEGGARRISARRSSLADPARALRMQGAPAGMREVLDSRSVRIQAQDFVNREWRLEEKRAAVPSRCTPDAG